MVAVLAALLLSPATQSAPDSTPQTPSAAAIRPTADLTDLQWLEQVDSPAVQQWVAQQNARTVAELGATAAYQRTFSNTLNYVNFQPKASGRASLQRQQQSTTDYQVNAKHPRGLLRHALAAKDPRGETVWRELDFQQLSEQEQTSWQYVGHSCAPTQLDQCLLYLSKGGGDAFVVREYDFVSNRFVEAGFSLPAGRHVIHWLSDQQLLLGTDWGPGTLSQSGFANELRIWQRGTALSSATRVFRGDPAAVSVNAFGLKTKQFNFTLLQEIRTFHDTYLHLWLDGKVQALAKPSKADIAGVLGDELLLSLQQDWPEHGMVSGSLVSIDMVAFQQGQLRVSEVFRPGPTEAIDQVEVTKDYLLLSVQHDIFSQLVRLQRRPGGWERRNFVPVQHASFRISHADITDNKVNVSASNYLVPGQRFEFDLDRGAFAFLAEGHHWFDSSDFTLSLHKAISKDGTAIPYIRVLPKQAVTGKLPLIIDAYGGFGISRSPLYNGGLGQDWLAHGGGYVVANVRGGGEYGPHWHQAALRENRIKTIEDLVAVAEQLIADQITSPQHLGIKGQSNGGLSACAAMVYRPDLFNAVSCDVPLTDMLRYPLLLAGSSWLAEYGDPGDPQMRQALLKYAPLQNLRSGQPYPPPFLQSSTRDDRVHPAHARKFVARLQQLGYPAWYFENGEGGHAGASTPEQIAQMWALQIAYFWHQLADVPAAG